MKISHDAYEGSFADFVKFRKVLALVSEIGLRPAPDDIKEFEEYIPNIDFEEYDEENSMGEWDEVPEEPLIIIFTHLDSGGVIHPQHMEPLIKRLDDIIAEVDDNPFFEEKDWVEQAKKFRDGLNKAHSNKEDLVFNVSAAK